MLRSLIAAALAAVFLVPVTAEAQVLNALTVASCGAQSLSAGLGYPLTMDLTGKLCTSGSGGGGGGGGAVTMAAGAVVSGAYLSGSLADGAIVTLGTVGDAATSGTSVSGNQTAIALLKGIYNGIQGPIASGTNVIGAVTQSGGPWTVTGSGTAGTAASGVLTVQGIASMTPVQVSQATASNLNAAVVGLGTAGSASGGVLTVQGVASMTPLLNTPTSQYPSGATPITASATGTTAATTATLAGVSSHTTYICGYSIRTNATAAATGNATVTGTITGTLNFTQWTAPAASGLGINEQVFMPCVPASAQNTGIAVISAAPGSGGVVSSTAWGYQL